MAEVEVDPELVALAEKVAALKGESLTDVIVRLLEQYVAE